MGVSTTLTNGLGRSLPGWWSDPRGEGSGRNELSPLPRYFIFSINPISHLETVTHLSGSSGIQYKIVMHDQSTNHSQLPGIEESLTLSPAPKTHGLPWNCTCKNLLWSRSSGGLETCTISQAPDGTVVGATESGLLCLGRQTSHIGAEQPLRVTTAHYRGCGAMRGRRAPTTISRQPQ